MKELNVKGLKKEILERGTVSEQRLIEYAKLKGLRKPLKSREAVVEWLLDHGLTWRTYELKLNPPVVSRINLCEFFGIDLGWRVLDIGPGIGGSSAAAASLAGKEGNVTAIELAEEGREEETLKRATEYLRRTELLDIVEMKTDNVLESTFEKDSFDIALLLYTLQYLSGYQELVEILKRMRKWTSLVGIADHKAVPSTFAESIFTMTSWIEHDVGREIGGEVGRTMHPFHEEEIKTALEKTGWHVIKEGTFPALDGSLKNAVPLWLAKKNLDRLERHATKIRDEETRTLLLSRTLTIRKMLETELSAPSFYAVLARRD